MEFLILFGSHQTLHAKRLAVAAPGTGNWTFVSFNITLDPNVAMVAVGLSPSDPGGASSGYWIDACGTYSSRIEGGQEVCITGPGPHNIWYGKSGGNANSAYTIRQIPKPTFPVDDSVRVGCSLPLHIYGLNNITMTSHNSLYDSWLNLSNPSDPIFTPGYVPPSGYIDFDISGNQIASTSCGVYTSSATVRIYIFNALVPSVNPNPANFCQGGSVSLTASATGGVSPYTFSWYNNATNTIISSASSTPPINTAGTYTVYVSDVLTSGGCLPVGLSRSVTETLQPTINAGTDDTVCATSPTALLNASITNASGVVWTSPGGGTFSPSSTALSPSYTASATDLMNGFVDLTCTATGCVNNSDVVRIYFDAGPSAIINTPTLNCNNSTGIVIVSPSGGFGATSYYWSNGATGSSQTFGAGTYSVTVVDAYGCGANHPFTLTSPSALSLVMSSTDETAPLAADGTASASPSGGTTPYSYLWNTSATSSSISGLSSAAYTVTVTDANGCSISGSTVVNLPICTGFNASASGTDVSCFGGNDGSATISFIGGAGSSGPYSYIWQTSPVQTTVTATGLTAGVYEVIVTDITLGCRSVATATVNQPTQLSNTMTHTDNSVIGGTSGTATANVSGGTPAYSYLWNNGQTSSMASGLAAGTYSVSITDANLCTISDNVIINEPPCNNFQAAVNTSGVLCFGESNGSATVVVAHGTAPYQYSLDGAAFIPNPSGTFTGLNGGAHTLNIMDASNCVVTQNFTINNPSALSVGLSPTSITCYGLSNGTIDLSVSGGTTPYSFEWINNNGNITIAHTEDVIGLAASTYSVTVTDANGCSTSASAGITMPSAISVTNITTDLTCNGTNDGAIDATVSGGQSPYTYAWTYPNGGSSTNEDISSLSPGQYLLTVTDANFCTRINSVNAYVNEPAVVNIINYTIDCPAPGNTFAVVTVDSISGGTDGPYQLSFDGGAYLSSGTYSTSLSINSTHTISAMDGNGCTTTSASTISIDPAVSISNVSFNPCIPSGSNSIAVTVTPTGGDGGNYQVSSDNGATFSALGVHTLNLPISQSYQIVVRDSSGCNSLPYSITIPGELIISGVADSVACLNGNDGSILVSSVGGTLPYNISWTGPSSGNPAGNEITSIGGTYSINNLSAGVYTITTTDANSCTSSTTITVGTTIDLINPSISCPGTISTNNQGGLCSAVVNFGTPVGTDNCPGAITTQLAGLASGSTFPVGTTTNTFLVTDAQGRTATCSFDVTIIDAELPGISCPAT
ncbi:MAG: HYR domain-containing protein, partial [Flavobacteriales bacterium]|nr:HYR domain-containing protein [Flavobacteriales bacterium]